MRESEIQYLAGLVVRAKQKDSDAFAELYAKTYNKVYNYTKHYLRDDFLAQDALQEIYISVLKNLNKLNDPTLFMAWLNRISFHVCYDISQKTGQGNIISDQEILEFLQNEHPDTDLESSTLKKDEHERLRIALESLPFSEKQVLTMRYYNNLKLTEIAAAMDISRSSVKRYIASGQKHLKQLLAEE